MGTTSKFIAGGLLGGAGEGMLAAAAARRRETLEMLRQEGANKRHGMALDRQQAQLEGQRGLLTSVQTDAGTGEAVGVTRGGETKRLGFRALSNKGGATKGGMTDNQLVNQVKSAHTTTRESIDGKQEFFNREGAEKALRNMGREDLIPLLPEDRKAPKSEDPDYREAKALAEKDAKDRAGTFRSDKEDFAEYGGSRSEFITAKTEEHYQRLKGEQVSPQYESAEAVGQAYKEGRITRAQAVKILQDQFGYD